MAKIDASSLICMSEVYNRYGFNDELRMDMFGGGDGKRERFLNHLGIDTVISLPRNGSAPVCYFYREQVEARFVALSRGNNLDVFTPEMRDKILAKRIEARREPSTVESKSERSSDTALTDILTSVNLRLQEISEEQSKARIREQAIYARLEKIETK